MEVEDDGFGISKENKSKIFKQYMQIDPGKLQEGKGSGLGLWSKLFYIFDYLECLFSLNFIHTILFIIMNSLENDR